MNARPDVSIRDRQLCIDGEPFLVLGGEMRNSSASTIRGLDRVWETCASLRLNTALVAVPWDLIEPERGRFDFAVVDALLAGADQRGLKLILLWFGSWKNGLSSYAPSWVKADPRTFPLVARADGRHLPILSAFSEATRDADGTAFATLLAHVAANDPTGVVVMVQVENEPGILGSARDHSPTARVVWEHPIEAALLERLRADADRLHPAVRDLIADAAPGASWSDLGAREGGDQDRVGELFQASGYAAHLEAVAGRGRAELPVPLFVNTWLDHLESPMLAGVANPFGGNRPGQYPSGGPVPHVFPVWKALAPSLDLLVPDLYGDDFGDRCAQYAAGNDGLFIPEMRRNRHVIGDIFVAIGEYGAIGTSPFGVDGVPGELPEEARALIAETYGNLAELAGIISDAQRRGEITGFRLNADHPRHECEIGGHRLIVTRDMERDPMPEAPESFGLVALDGTGRFIGTGSGFRVSFESLDPAKAVWIESVDTGRFVDGDWQVDLVLNGDETLSHEFWRFPYLDVIPGLAWGLGSPVARISRCTTYEFPAFADTLDSAVADGRTSTEGASAP